MRVLFLLVAVLATAMEAGAQAPLVVGSLTAQPGQKVSGWLEVPDGVDAGTRIPVSLVHGARPGAVLALVAGTHGYEYTSILALTRVLARLDPQRMTGSVILVHMANPSAFYGRRIYYSADLHCGDGNESLRPYSYWQVSGNAAVDEASKQMVLAFGLDHVVVDRERPTDLAKSMYTSNTAVLRGKPALTAESGGMGLTDEASVAAQEAGASSLIAHLGIADLPTVRVRNAVWFDRSEVLRATATGLWYPAVEKMQTVAAGTVLGRVREVLYVVGTPPVSEGEPLAFVGHLLDGEPQPWPSAR